MGAKPTLRCLFSPPSGYSVLPKEEGISPLLLPCFRDRVTWDFCACGHLFRWVQACRGSNLSSQASYLQLLGAQKKDVQNPKVQLCAFHMEKSHECIRCLLHMQTWRWTAARLTTCGSLHMHKYFAHAAVDLVMSEKAAGAVCDVNHKSLLSWHSWQNGLCRNT